MNKRYISTFLGVMAIAGVLIGCGGGGGSNGGGGTDGGTNGTGGTTNLNLTYQLNGFSGTLVGNVAASSTPQTVHVTVGGTERTISNVVVANDCASGSSVQVLSEGSQLLNIQVTNPGVGISFPESTVHAPISSSGVLTTSIMSPGLLSLTTPPATLDGHNLQHGLNVGFSTSAAADVRAGLNDSFELATGTDKSGTTSMPFVAPTARGFMALTLGGRNYELDVNPQAAVNTLPSGSGTLSVPWTASRFDKGTTTDFPMATLVVIFTDSSTPL